MTFTLSILGFFVGLVAIIVIHELGHYLTARVFGFRVLEYFVGFGPRLWSFRRGEIEYGLKAIPAGGYVKIAGMNPFVNDVPPGDEDRAYGAKPIWQRAVVIIAGPLSHFLVAGLVFAGLFFFVGDSARTDRPIIEEVAPTIEDRASPASRAGLRPGDVIVRIGDIENPTPAQLGEYQQAHLGEPIEYAVDRAGRIIHVTMTPVAERTDDGETRTRIGVLLGAERDPPLPALVYGFVQVWDTSVESVKQLAHVFGPEGVSRTFSLLFSDEQRTQADPTSVVGIGQQVGAIGQRGEWATYFWFFGVLTLFVGLVNLLPLPPFDGGHLAVLLVEKVRRKPVDMRRVVPVSAAVLSFFVLFTLATIALDVWKPIPISGP